MKIPSQNPTAGGSILIILGVLLLAVTLVGTAVLFSSTQNRQASRQREVAETNAAADGALEYTYAVWRNLIRNNGNRALNNAKLADGARIQSLKAGMTEQTSPGAELAATGKSLSGFGIQMTDPWGKPLTTEQEKTPYTVPVDDFPGWSGQAFFYKASLKATGPKNKVSATVARHFSQRSVPLFQAAIFYMDNLEIHPGALMTINGLVHSNASIYAASFDNDTDNTNNGIDHPKKLQFLDKVSYIGDFYEAAPGAYDWSGYGVENPPQPTLTPYWKDNLQSGSSTERPNQLHDLDVNGDNAERIEPFGKGPQALFDPSILDPTKQPDSNQNNDGYHEWIEPPVAGTGANADPKEISGARHYNNADLRIQIDSSKAVGDALRITVTDGNGAALSSSVTSTQVKAAISASTTIYDWREGGGVAPIVANGNDGNPAAVMNVTLTSIDMKALNTALTGMGSNFNGILYVHDIAAPGSPPPASNHPQKPTKKAIRLRNGSVLAKDLTVASVNPVYIQGDYNTGNTVADPKGNTSSAHNPLDVPTNKDGNTNGTESPIVPGYEKKSTAVISDAVSILSNNWNDDNSKNTLPYRPAAHTTVNAAIMGGDVPTDYKDSNKASGGAHNFPRFLEMWYNPSTKLNIDLTYYGSMVQAFTSKTFDSPWRTGNVYVWPNRKWSFDKQFTSNPPPGSTAGMKIFRGRWERQ